MKETLTESISGLIEQALDLKKKLETAELIPTSHYLNVDQASKYLGITKNGLYSLMHKKLIPYTRPSGKFAYFSVDDLEEFKSRNRQKSVFELESGLA